MTVVEQLRRQTLLMVEMRIMTRAVCGSSTEDGANQPIRRLQMPQWGRSAETQHERQIDEGYFLPISTARN